MKLSNFHLHPDSSYTHAIDLDTLAELTSRDRETLAGLFGAG
ncbi:hypothetical protein ACIGO9_29645 [Nocardia asteroides]